LRLDLAELCGVVTNRAEQAENAAMPAYTHCNVLNRAGGTLAAAYVEMFLRDADRWPTAGGA